MLAHRGKRYMCAVTCGEPCGPLLAPGPVQACNKGDKGSLIPNITISIARGSAHLLVYKLSLNLNLNNSSKHDSSKNVHFLANVGTHPESTRSYLWRRQNASDEKIDGRCGKVRSWRTFPWRYTYASDASTRRHSSPRPKVN